jgi:hypothetical protein
MHRHRGKPGRADEATEFLDKNSGVIAWSSLHLVGVSRDIIEHWPQVRPSARPKKQKL